MAIAIVHVQLEGIISGEIIPYQVVREKSPDLTEDIEICGLNVA